MKSWPKDERGRRWGWILGFMGASLWILLASIMLFIKPDLAGASLSLGLYFIILFFIFNWTPWKRPDTAFWKMYLVNVVFILSMLPYFAWRFDLSLDDLRSSGLSLVVLIPILIPIFILGRKSWNELVKSKDQG